MDVRLKEERKAILAGRDTYLKYYQEKFKDKQWRVAWAIPSADCRMNTQLFVAYLQMIKPPRTVLVIKNFKPLHRNRNEIIKFILNNYPDITHIFWTDDDMYPMPPHTLARLLSREVPIICAPAATKETNSRWVLGSLEKSDDPDVVVSNRLQVVASMYANPFRFLPEYKDKCVEVGAGNMACTLISTDVYRTMEQPWYWPYYNKETGYYWEADMVFFHKARKDYGFKNYCDFTVLCLHMEKHVAYPNFLVHARTAEYTLKLLEELQQ